LWDLKEKPMFMESPFSRDVSWGVEKTPYLLYARPTLEKSIDIITPR
jgi:hypothetical protein